jgi:hypothetical protein
MEDESTFRIKNEEDQRRYIDQKMVGIEQKLKGDEKNQLDREKRLMG